MTTKHGLLFAASLAVIAVLYQTEVLTNRWEAEDYAVINVKADQLWDLLTQPDVVDKWFQWVSLFRAVDSRPLSRGKRFEAVYSLPVVGDYVMGLQVVEYTPQRVLVLESDALLKPRITFALKATADKDVTKLTLKLVYRRNSALFRCTMGPIMWLLTSQQLRHSLFLIKMLFPAA